MKPTGRTFERLVRPLVRVPVRLLARRQGSVPNDPPRRILLLRHDRIGDWIVTTPLVDAIRHAFPNVEIDVIASEVNAAIVRADDRITRVHVLPHEQRGRVRMVRKCRALQYDVALQLLFNRTTLPVLFLRRCAPRGLIIGKPDYRSQFLLDRTVDPGPGHYSQRTLRFARALIGEHWKEPPARMSIRIPAAVSDDAQRSIREHGLTIGAFVLINVSAGARDRSIGPTLAAGIAERLRKAGVAVALSGEPSDWGLVDEVCRKTGAVMLTANSLVEAIALYQYPEAVITPDTAMLHVASATGRPVVALFGERGDPEGWGPQSVHQRTILADRGTTVTTGIRAEQVVESALELLRLVRT